LRVLMVEDSENDALLLLRELRRGGYEPLHEVVSTSEEMERSLGEASSRGEPWEVVLSDYHMPRFGALAALEALRGLGYETPFVVVSGKIGEDAAVEMMRAGAQDYVTKENMVRLCPAIERELREAEGRRERRRAQEALRFLSEASAELSSSLDYHATLARVARLAVPHLADWCAVDVLEEDGSTRRLAVEHQDPAKVALALELQERYPSSPDARSGLPHVLRTGSPEFYPEVTDAMVEAAAHDAEHLRILREIGFTSAIVVPMIARGKTLGALTLVSAESGRRYEKADLGVAEELARRAALAVDNSRLYDEAKREIAERERAQEELRDFGEQLEIILRGVADGITAQDPSGELIYANDAAARIVGFPTAEAFVKAPVREVMQRFELADETGRPLSLEDLPGRKALQGESAEALLRFREVATGRERWSVISATPVFDERGRVRLAVNIFRDITEGRRAEEALRQSEERYRATFEQAAVGVGQVALDGRWLRANDKLCEISGYDREELLEKTFQELTHPEDLDADLEQAERLLAGEIETYSMEKRYVRKDGSVVWINLTVSLVREPSGAPKYFVSVVEDISERKRAEEDLRQSEERYRAVVEQSAEGLYLVDGYTKRILETNRALQNMLGYSPEELREMRLHEIVAHDPESVNANVERTIREGRRFIRERRYRRKDGSVVSVEVAASTINYGGKQVICAAIRDITERKQAEEALREAREAERNRIARDLHDDILQDIVYALQEIQVVQITAEDGAPSGLEEAAEALRRSVEGLRGAIFELRLKEALVRSFVASLEVLIDLNRRMARGRYELDLIVDDEFPETLPERTGRELVRIVQEALANVRRHAQPRRVRVRLWSDDDLAGVEVTDDGRGFDAGKPGVGIGQQSMKHRAHELGGELRVESAPGSGTRVLFEIPASRLVAETRSPRSGGEGAPTA
jgi:PAS domain S-box-containing protein